MFDGLFGLLILVADIYAIYNILTSRAETGPKVLWTALVVLLPLIGVIIWYFAGPKSASA